MPKKGQMKGIPHSPLSAAVTLLGGTGEATVKIGEVSRQTLHDWLKRGRICSDKELQVAMRINELLPTISVEELLAGSVRKRN